jgi:peptidoglycan/LPS O-acetylase OafA/YrhL
MSTTAHINQRLHGLDTLRAFAIVIVLLYHYMVAVSGEETFGYITAIGWMGVDLFFVLSGYLIGNQLLSAIAKREEFSLKRFYIRRLLRTLPNYYVVLLLYFLFPAELTGKTSSPLWQFLTFTQNFDLRPGATFSHSWSLCVEEQFYLLFPLIFIALAQSKHFVKLAWLTLAVGMLLGLGLRFDAWYSYGESAINWQDFYKHIYYSSLTRFDELLPGIALALLKNFHQKQFQYLLKHANRIFWVGLLAISIMMYLFPHFHFTDEHGMNLWLSTFGYSCVAISFSLLVLSSLSSESILGKVRIPGAMQIALWSYALYLIHRPVFKLLIEPLNHLQIDVKGALGVSIVMSLSVLAAYLLYLLVETPFMRLRSRHFPHN